MAWITRSATNTLAGLLKASDGLSAAMDSLARAEQLHLPELKDEQIRVGSVFDEKRGASLYPQVAVFCERIMNRHREKFRSFSGTASVVVEVTMSAERAELTEQLLHLQAEAITKVLERNQGDWGNGLFYGGKYEVKFKGAKSGGRNYIHTARIELDVESSEPFAPE